MAFKLTLGDVIEFPVKGHVRDGAGSVPFSFTVCAKRITVDRYRETFGDASGTTKRDFLAEHVTDWRGQKFVHDESGNPADYCVDALDVLLSVVGMDTTLTDAYIMALQISDTPAGRAKN